MDEEILALVAIALIGTGALVGLAFSPVARAFAERIRGRPWSRERRDRDELEESVDDLKQDVEEMGRQLRFLERLLTGRRERGQLGPGDVAR